MEGYTLVYVHIFLNVYQLLYYQFLCGVYEMSLLISPAYRDIYIL